MWNCLHCGGSHIHFEAIGSARREFFWIMPLDFSITEIRVDGGAAKSNLLMQFQADMMGVPVIRPKNVELTALGAALLAGLAIGFWKNKEDITSHLMEERRFVPSMPQEKVLAYRSKWEKAVHCAKIWAEN